jgi:hypothetical protein
MDPVRRYFEQGYDAVLLGDFSNIISGDQFEDIKDAIRIIYEKTNLKILITEFNVELCKPL